jgi:hypothetical protein
MKNLNSKIHRDIYIDFIHEIGEELTEGKIDGDFLFELDRLILSNVLFDAKRSFRLINSQVKNKISNEKSEQ